MASLVGIDPKQKSDLRPLFAKCGHSGTTDQDENKRLY